MNWGNKPCNYLEKQCSRKREQLAQRLWGGKVSHSEVLGTCLYSFYISITPWASQIWHFQIWAPEGHTRSAQNTFFTISVNGHLHPSFHLFFPLSHPTADPSANLVGSYNICIGSRGFYSYCANLSHHHLSSGSSRKPLNHSSFF